jgi:hypothetical protein
MTHSLCGLAGTCWGLRQPCFVHSGSTTACTVAVVLVEFLCKLHVVLFGQAFLWHCVPAETMPMQRGGGGNQRR